MGILDDPIMKSVMQGMAMGGALGASIGERHATGTSPASATPCARFESVMLCAGSAYGTYDAYASKVCDCELAK
jgi:hypothetical protein